jgi:hypothetical protein
LTGGFVEVAMARQTGTTKERDEERRRELVERLDRAGLELWRSEEGFYAIRPKPQVAEPVAGSRRSRRRRAG